MCVTDNYDLSLLYLHEEFFLACMCMVLLPRVFHVRLTLRMLSVVVGPRACCSSNVSCAIVIYLSYCYDQLSFAAFMCLLRNTRHYSGDKGGILSESVSLEAVFTDLSWQALLAGGWKLSTLTWSWSRCIWSVWNYILVRTK